jgi:chromosome segregation protein
VDAALSLKPEERRRFFEEAAGIGLYRTRREDTLNRLDATRRNLERVQDILAELEPRLATLERQAKRAAEYERVKADLRVLLRDWYGYYWHRNNAELIHARETLRVQEARLEQTRTRMEQVVEEAEALRGKIQTVRISLNEWHGQSAALHQQWEQVSRKLAVLEERQRAVNNSQAGLESDLNRFVEEEQARRSRLEELEVEQTRLQKELAEASEQVEAARKNLQARQSERDRVESALRDARRVLVNLETGQVQAKAHINEINSRLENLRRTLQNYHTSIGADEKAVEEAEIRLNKTKDYRLQADEEVEQLEEELTVQRRQLTALENERRTLQDARSRLEGDLSRIKAQLEVLDQAERSLSGLGQGARNLVLASRQGKIKSNLQTLSSQMVVAQEYEVAIAAALADLVDGLVVQEGEVEPALAMLEGGDQGRAHLIPLGDLRKNEISTGLDDPDILGTAARLIQVPIEIQGVVDLLLGNVLIAKNRSAARRVARKIPLGSCVVTLKGEVYWANGVISAGKENRSGVVARPRQRQEFLEILDTSRSAVQENQQKLEKLENTLQQSRETTQKLEKELKNSTSRFNQLAQEVQQANLTLEKARHQLEWQKNQLQDVERQIQKSETDLQATQKQVNQAGAEIQKANDLVRENVRGLNALPMDDYQTQLTHWNTGVAVTGRALTETNARMKDLAQALETNLAQQRALRERFAANQNALVQAENEKVSLLEQQTTLNGQIEQFRERIEPAEVELSGLEQEYSRVQVNLTTAQQALAVAERYSSQAQMDLTRQREGLDSLRRRIEEDFGLVSFEYSDQVEGQTTLPLDGMVEQLPKLIELPTDLEENINRQRAHLRRMGPISPEALNEYREVKERRDFMVSQVEDLKKADVDLRQVIAELDELMKREFRKTFTAVAAEFRQMFTRLFNGGSATLELVDEDNLAEAGIEIEARLPGRREQGLSLLSGGERSLTAAALIFSLLKVSPTPFCVLDEVDAMLDEANVGRYRDLLKELSAKTQFIVITHNRNTVQAADVIYGVTMGRDSASQVISLRLDEIGDEMVR